MPAKTLADRLRWIIANRGFSDQKALSVAAGLSPSHVGQMIRGDTKGQPAAETLAKIAKAASVDLHWLTTGEGEPGPRAEPTVDRTDIEPAPPDSPDGVDTEPLLRALARVYADGKGKWTNAELRRAEEFVRKGRRSITTATDEALVQIATSIMRAVHDRGVQATDAEIGMRDWFGKLGPSKP